MHTVEKLSSSRNDGNAVLPAVFYIDNSNVEHGCCWDTAICRKVPKGDGNYGSDYELFVECSSENAEFILAALNTAAGFLNGR